ncbi:MAG: adenylate kinase [Leptolyngbya sp.]|nr:MAG: adenylate kinase [Leptolyngbya sp.]
MPRLIFLGAPGAGKGTQAKLIADFCKIPHVSTGDILRAAVANQTSLGLQAKSYMDKGDLVPDQLVVALIQERLNNSDAQKGWILDGFPRNVAQAEFLDSLLNEIDQPCDYVVNLEVPDEVLAHRMLERGRTDDTEEVIRNRLKVYREQTSPLIDFYLMRKKLTVVNGNQFMEGVAADLKKLI